MIDINKLTKDDIGKWVLYDPGYMEAFGKIKSWNDSCIFVVFNCAGEWDNFTNYTGQSTKPENLTIMAPEGKCLK